LACNMKTYNVYKGLQKPLVFKGFKGKYIYWGIGSLVTGLVVGAVFIAIVNMVFGILALVLVSIGGIFYTSAKQKQGLYSKKRHKGLYIIPSRFKYANYGKKTKQDF